MNCQIENSLDMHNILDSRKRDDGRIEFLRLCPRCNKHFWSRVKIQKYCNRKCAKVDGITRFWERVKKSYGCWEWIGNKNTGPMPYGRIKVGGKEFKAHVYSWIIHNGDNRNGLCVCHSCDNPSCVNPNHLWIGTSADNVHDCISKGRATRRSGRGKSRFGEAHPHAKLTDEAVKIIRKEYQKNKRGFGASSLSQKYGVSKQVILGVIHRKGWAHI